MKVQKEIVENAKDASERLKAHQENIKNLQKKSDEIEATLPTLKSATAKAAQDKQKAIEDFCMNEGDQDAVERAQGIYDNALNTEHRTEEILTVITSKIEAIEESTMHLIEQQREFVTKLWSALANKLEAQLRAEIIDKVKFAYAANRRGHHPLNHNNFLRQLFPEPQKAELDMLNPDLDKLYNKAARG